MLGVPRFFYQELVGDNRDPTYYGQTVEPGEAEKVLLRWRLDDGLYRVIFGDLSARTISAKELAELENY